MTSRTLKFLAMGWGVLWISACVSESPSVTPPESLDWRMSIPLQLIKSGQQAADPWAMAHLHLALPEDPVLEAPRQELFRLLTDSSAEIPIHGHDGHRGEQHPHLLLRTAVLLSGSDPSPELLERVRADLAKTAFPDRWQEVNDLAWLLEAVARSPLPLETPGAETTLPKLVEKVIADLEVADQLIANVLAQDPSSNVRRPDGLAGPQTSGCWAYTCSGAHLLGAVVECDLAGWLSAPQRERLGRLLENYRLRTDWELAYRKAELDRAIKNGISPRRATREYGLAVTKLLGHALEISTRASLLAPTEENPSVSVGFSRWSVKLMHRIDDLFSQSAGESVSVVYNPLEILTSAAITPQSPVWERAFGDLCHLFRGLRLLNNPQRY